MGRLDQQRERIQEDLRGLIAGEVRCDDLFLHLFSSDGSIYQIRPLGVVRPRSTADVAACVKYAAENQLPIHARGAGTGTDGGALGSGLVLDFSKYLRRVLAVQRDSVRVQPGIVYERLNAQLRPMGRMFGPDPATAGTTTIGSMIAVDAVGSRWLKYGSTRRHVLGLQVVLADGHVLEIGREPLAGNADAPARKRELVDRVAALLRQNAELIRQARTKCPVDHCGYNLSDVLGEDSLDLARLLAGSEGTLALTTEAQLATQPLPRHRGVVLLLFDSLDKASRAVAEILPLEPTACDLMDRRHLSLAREAEVRFHVLIPPEAEAVLLVEYEGDDPLEIRDRAHRLVDTIRDRKRLAIGARQAFDPAETELFWLLATRFQPPLRLMKAPDRPVPVVEDVAAPPELLPDFLVRVQNVLKRHEATASLFCHAAQGQLHVQPFLDLTDPADVRRMRDLADDLYREVGALGGTISGEHACGLSRTAYVARQVGPLVDVFRELKHIFDPAGLLNPGKIVGDDPELLTRHLHPAVATRPPEAPDQAAPADSSGLRDLVELQLNWESARIAGDAVACARCGSCRSQAADLRMCPVFRLAPGEESSPRAKANLIRGVLSGQVALSALTSGEYKRLADLCVYCQMCRVECPARVDVPKLMREAKGAHVMANGLPLADWLLTRLDLLGTLGGLVSPATNRALRSRPMRWLMEKTLGIAQGRKLPRVASRSFLRRAARRRLTRPARHGGQRVLYFVDVYANHFDPHLAEAVVAVLEHNTVSVFVPFRQRQAGMASIACGELEHARRLAHHNVVLLADAVRHGYHIVASEPSAAMCLTREYPELLDDDDARLVAENSSEVCSYLWRRHTSGKLQLDFRPIHASLAYHMPCHLKALDVGAPGENLLRLIPGLRVQRIEQGCSGMAGTFGLKQTNYRSSLRAGWGLISRLRDPAIQAGTTECSACKIQMEQGTTKPTLHPIKLLALAYGLMPEVATMLNATGEELIVT